MNALAMATGSLPAARACLGLMTYPPKIAAVRQARRYVQDAVATSATPTLAEDAALLVTELAVNAVLHARTDFDVAVESTTVGVRVSVRDRSPAMPVLAVVSATAMSGRGLALVAALASRWGVAASACASKSVWFELSHESTDPGGASPSAAGGSACDGGESVEAAFAEALSTSRPLVASRKDAYIASAPAMMPLITGSVAGAGEVSRCAEGVEVVLPALDAADLLGAEEAMQDVLRELQLVMLSETSKAGHTSDRTDRGDPASATDAGHGPWAMGQGTGQGIGQSTGQGRRMRWRTAWTGQPATSLTCALRCASRSPAPWPRGGITWRCAWYWRRA